MPRTSYGDEKQQQSWILLESILMEGVTSSSYSSDSSSVKLTFQENEKGSFIGFRGTLQELRMLTESRLDSEQIRESLTKHLSDEFLDIYNDLRTKKSGPAGGEWHFTIKIWSTDIATNREEFNRLWKSKKRGNAAVTSRENFIPQRITGNKTPGAFKLEPMENFLEPYISLVDEFIEAIGSCFSTRDLSSMSSDGRRVNSLLIEVIESVTKTTAVLVCQYDKKSERAYVDPLSPAKKKDFAEILASELFPNMCGKAVFDNDSHGRILKYNGLDYLFIPLAYQSSNSSQISEFLALCGVSKDADASILGEPAGKIISTVYSLDKPSIKDSESVAAQIIDALKKSFKFVPFCLYERRFNAFTENLKRMTVYFQPIVESKNFRIESWEALARDPDTRRAPTSLFETAELWGIKFMTELDLHFLDMAVNTYRSQLTALKLQRGNDMLPLAVNVYPDSLMRDSYLERVLGLTD